MNREWLEALRETSFKEDIGMSDKAYRKWLKKQYLKYGKTAMRDRLAHSMGDGLMWQRFRADSDGEGWCYYGFASDAIADDYCVDSCDELTDSEVTAWFDECMAVVICSDYDCTGRTFTYMIDWHRNPDGSISFVHRMSVDV